jgi:DNA-directed RNA polymerase
MDWLQEVAEVCINNDVIPQWTTPLGLPVRMHYEKQEHLNIKTNVFGVVRQTRIRQDSGAPSKRKSVNSIAPNWVHSMDGVAGLLGESVNIALDNSVRDYLTVHDDYEVHAPNVPTMAAAARLATINIFSGNLMQDTHNEIQYLLPSGVDLPEPPPQGDLDVSLVKKAQYYFS